MISTPKFIEDVKEICFHSKTICMDEPWTLREGAKNVGGGGLWMEQTSFINDPLNGRPVKRNFAVCFSETYGVPVFWFNFYDESGRLLLFDHFQHFAFSSDEIRSQMGESISQNEHPFLGIAFYNLHPCKTSELMRSLKPRNFVLSFLSTIGSLFKTNWPLALFTN
ncbi:hypothetical protein niasHT_029897 [Heterodera trifolii]|uniref:Ubiquitin-like-conjugating enzyme ATG10 n=1 Tax=Heterodera trifolii TaxID=157864 RepID=A0ABD2KBG4_9BILA